MTPRSLAEFVRWFLEQPLGSLRPPQAPVGYYVLAAYSGGETVGARATGLLLYRSGQYQVELFTVLPSPAGVSFAEHRHPDVDSIEHFLSGDIAFTLQGRRVATDEELHELAPDGAHALCGERLSVRHKDWHGGFVGPSGGCFLSIQRWRDGVTPTSVTLNWEGPAHLSVNYG